jgi:carbonic anhydrase/acetyltransferase-like protein (isoleucine patch superfamily)
MLPWVIIVLFGSTRLLGEITIGDNTNIQDGAVIHCTYLTAATCIGSNVSIGHNALVHGCTLQDYVLIGMGAIVMDHATVQEFCIIAAGAIVLENTVCESGYLYAGVPARKIKPLTEKQIALLKRLPENYKLYSNWFIPDSE